MSRKLTQKEFEEIAVLSRYCIDAYNSRQVTEEISRLKHLAKTLDVHTDIRTLIIEIVSYSHESSKQKPMNEKDNWVDLTLKAIKKLESQGVDREGNKGE